MTTPSLAFPAAAALALVSLAACDPLLPDPPQQCDPAGVVPGKAGCLSDEICVDFKCVPRPKCELDADCPSSAYQCVRPAQICELREGFGEECQEPDAPCGVDQFCGLGVCRPTERECTSTDECPTGERCDPLHFFCIPDADCRLASDFPEAACWFDETCDALTGRCNLECPADPPCTPGDDDTCPGDQRCDGSCRCVDCIEPADCGPGLVCNQRTGECQSENICFGDEDCDPPLICGETALCEVAPPACLDDFDCPIAEVCDLASGRCIEPGGVCVEDYFEETDTPANAQELTITPGVPRIDDALTLCPDDDDVFSIVLEAGQQLTATLVLIQPEDGGARATLWLYDETAENALRFSQAPPFGSGRIVYVAQEAGVVYLRANALLPAADGAADYDLITEIEGGAPCEADFFEPNDTASAPTLADTVPLGVDLNGTVCPGDADFYEVIVGAGEALTATLSFDGTQSDLDLAFVDEAGALITQDAGGGAPERLRKRFPADDTVIVRVRGFGTSTGSYTLRMETEPPFVCTPDVAEPDNDAATAPEVPVNGELPPQARTMCQADSDLLRLPLEDFERVVVRAVYEDADVEIAIDILDEAGAVLATSPPATGGAAVAYDANGDETVLARVRGAGGAIGPYTLSVEKENQLDCAPDASEPNDDVDVATAADALPDPSELLSICESDEDFFAIAGERDKKLVVDASFRQADADIDLMLLGLDGEQILAVADGTSDGEHLEFILPLDGTYTLRVFSLTSGARARYSLDVQQVSP